MAVFFGDGRQVAMGIALARSVERREHTQRFRKREMMRAIGPDGGVRAEDGRPAFCAARWTRNLSITDWLVIVACAQKFSVLANTHSHQKLRIAAQAQAA